SAIRGTDGKPAVATLGLAAEEIDLQASAGLPAGRQARSISSSDGDRIHSGIAVPLAGEEGELGYLAVFSLSPSGAFDEAVRTELELLAAGAGPAIDNAKRFREARQLADL